MNGKLCPALLNKLTKQIVEQLHGSSCIACFTDLAHLPENWIGPLNYDHNTFELMWKNEPVLIGAKFICHINAWHTRILQGLWRQKYYTDIVELFRVCTFIPEYFIDKTYTNKIARTLCCMQLSVSKKMGYMIIFNQMQKKLIAKRQNVKTNL